MGKTVSKAGKQGIWPKAEVTKAAWLEVHGIPFVYGANQAMKLLEVLNASVEVQP